MKKLIILILTSFFFADSYAQGGNEDPNFASSNNLQISNTNVVFDDKLNQLIFTIEVNGQAGTDIPTTFGQLDGAPVLGYVFPTTLNPTDVGFNNTTGIVAMALTSHPDFDDTPLWDEDNDQNYTNDGVIWHSHWVILDTDTRIAGGLSVKQFDPNNNNVVLPPTNPGMPMYMDSPGYPVITQGNIIRVVVPIYRINNKSSFNFDAATAYMQVNTSDPNLPMLGVYKVYSIASGNLSLPYTVTR